MALLEEPEPPKRSALSLWILILLALIVIAMGVLGYEYFAFNRPPVTTRTRPAEPVAPEVPAPKPAEPAAPAQPRTEEHPRPRAPRHEAPTPAPAPAPAAPTTGTVTIDSDVPGASVFIDRRYVGKTPITQADIEPGSHHLNVSTDGYDPYSSTIDVKPGPQQVDVKFKQVKLDEKIAVVHKHRFGSCQGTLIATPQGLQYDTTDKNDAFKVPFSQLETFDVDYLKNNLEIKVKNGRTYNFTEQKGGPDTLFVFHREVQKARDLMKKVGELK